jgi:hypothetical protein
VTSRVGASRSSLASSDACSEVGIARVVVGRNEAAVGDGDPMGVTGEIAQHPAKDFFEDYALNTDRRELCAGATDRQKASRARAREPAPEKTIHRFPDMNPG